jgi:hypothetical protein
VMDLGLSRHQYLKTGNSTHFVTITRVAIIALILVTVIATRLDGGVIVNEVLANEPGPDVTLEWVELYNIGPDTVALTDYVFTEGNDSTWFDDTLRLQPFSFAVLSRRPTAGDGESSFESHWGDNSGIWGDHPSEDYLLIEAKFSLKNSDDCVRLLETRTGLVDSVCWDKSAPDGVSLERISPFKPSDSDNLALSRDVTGSTPGRINSIPPMS